MSQQTFKPLVQYRRIQTIDILRGIALFGILIVNIPYFGIPDYFQWSFNQKQNPYDMSYWLMIVVSILFEGKMATMFSIIFGAGILLFIFGKEKKKQTATRLFYRRMFWLVLFGLILFILADVHFLLWDGDIFYFYGIVGMLAYLFRHLSKRYLLLAIPIVALIGILNSLYLNYNLHMAKLAYNEVITKERKHLPLTEQQQEKKERYLHAEKIFLPVMKERWKKAITIHSGYHTLPYNTWFRTGEYQTKYLLMNIWDPLSLMLLGMALFKSAFLIGRRSKKSYIRTAVIGYLIGLPLSVYAYFHNLRKYQSQEAILNFVDTKWLDLTPAAYEIQRIALALAHISLIILIIHSGLAKRLMDRFSAIGQMAFTNYILQIIICTLLFYGFGLLGRLQYDDLLCLAAGIWALQAYLSPIWLRYYNFGPLEWLWRSLTYGRLLPFKKMEEPLLFIVPNGQEKKEGPATGENDLPD